MYVFQSLHVKGKTNVRFHALRLDKVYTIKAFAISDEVTELLNSIQTPFLTRLCVIRELNCRRMCESTLRSIKGYMCFIVPVMFKCRDTPSSDEKIVAK